jgi:hypothetical protein
MMSDKRNKQVLNIADNRELFLDDYLVEELNGTSMKMHIKSLDIDDGMQKLNFSGFEARESNYAYPTIIWDEGMYKLYYRGYTEGWSGDPSETACYAYSQDGLNFFKPALGLYEVQGSKLNNVILADICHFAHNFSPFVDTRPGVSREERYKALAGHKRGGGLKPFVSADGINWNPMVAKCVIKTPDYSAHGFDSQNVAFWSESEDCYVSYFRTWKKNYNDVVLDEPGYGVRWISRSTSKDFINWTDAVELVPDNGIYEHLYTNQTAPYFRASQIYISLATRFVPSEEKNRLTPNTTDISVLTSRGNGNVVQRKFMESFIRPGLDEARWTNRSNYAALNIVPADSRHMAIIMTDNQHGLWRMLLRTDGIASLNAGYSGGEMITKPFTFKGNSLDINYATSSVGNIRAELQDCEGRSLDGFELDNCNVLYGDKISDPVIWTQGESESDLSKLSGKSVRLRLVLKDADIYSIRFQEKKKLKLDVSKYIKKK